MVNNKSLSSKLFTILFFLGLVLITTVFLLIVPEKSRTNIVWLNFTVIMFVFILTYGHFQLFALRADKKKHVLPVFLSSTFFIIIYDVISIIICILSIINIFNISFKSLLSIHFILLFLLFLTLTITFLATRRSGYVINIESKKTKILDSLKSQSNRIYTKIQMLNKKNKNIDIKDKYIEIRDKIRYLSPNSLDESIKLENKMKKSLDIIEQYIEEIDSAKSFKKENILQEIKKLYGIIKLRKEIYEL